MPVSVFIDGAYIRAVPAYQIWQFEVAMGIVALARKLLVALWKYVNAGVVIEGAVIKTA
ncbi:hypothetical protein GGD50_005835 [Rhizobium paranaense]|uniref:Uncharacterized protein n=1 Tax=Rhizobium paranaense TaxID=1650438 RepID=A0A7W8XX29_9HYPH|nr:hypothetical protein [Rhizobium paranaense]